MIKIKQKIVPQKKEEITWSEDLIIELHDKHLTIKCNYVGERFKNEDELQGKEPFVKEYETHILKSDIYSSEWAWDGEDEVYCFQVICRNSSLAYNCENKKQAIEHCNKILAWLLS